ncbi:Htur_1727 family rSAM-partnered candidate RiPP [Halobaculum sp. EA56]|uniref:Htur_1727 family rSAM-partnered candidate RiPP n=1 Tax=Halobaculum sp. EA56 TaxID=3421648 RepID=UPI003EBE26A1
MDDTDRRTRTDAPRADDAPEWEVFRRGTTEEPLRHVGSVTAPTSEVAHEHADTLFPDAVALWLCRSDLVERFDERTLGAAYSHDSDGTMSETGTDGGRDRGDASDGDRAAPPGGVEP